MELISIFVICLIIGAIIIAYIKKFMLTYTLIIVNFLIFILTIVFPGMIYELGFRPVYLSLNQLPQIYTIFTSMFVHSVSDPMHIIGNMIVLLFMGIAFEYKIGPKKFIVIYLITGIIGALTHSLLNLSYPNNQVVLIGASGAIFGILGAFAFLYPHEEIVVPIPVFIVFFARIKVLYAAMIFVLMETIFVYFGDRGNTAHFAHFGGLIGGVIIAAILMKGKKTEDKKTGKTIYVDAFSNQKPVHWNFPNLRSLAANNKQEELLTRIEKETVPQVRDLWLEHFLEKTKCPKCGSPLNHFDRNIWCEKCGFKTTY